MLRRTGSSTGVTTKCHVLHKFCYHQITQVYRKIRLSGETSKNKFLFVTLSKESKATFTCEYVPQIFTDARMGWTGTDSSSSA